MTIPADPNLERLRRMVPVWAVISISLIRFMVLGLVSTGPDGSQRAVEARFVPVATPSVRTRSSRASPCLSKWTCNAAGAGATAPIPTRSLTRSLKLTMKLQTARYRFYG